MLKFNEILDNFNFHYKNKNILKLFNKKYSIKHNKTKK